MQLFYAGKTNKQKAFDAVVYLFRTSNSPQEHPFFVFIKLDLHNRVLIAEFCHGVETWTNRLPKDPEHLTENNIIL